VARITVLGSSGTGKSWYAGWVLENTALEFEHAVHLDYEDEEKGMSLADNPMYLSAYIDEELLGKVDFENLLRKDKRLRVVPDGLTKSEIRELAEKLADAALEVGGCFFSWDEAHNVTEKHDIGDRMERLATGGRKYGVEWLAVTQRPQNLHEDVLSQANVTVCFSVDSDRDLKKVVESTSMDRSEIKTLDERQAIIENHDSGEMKKIDTNNLDRKYPHVAGDDGKAEDVLF